MDPSQEAQRKPGATDAGGQGMNDAGEPESFRPGRSVRKPQHFWWWLRRANGDGHGPAALRAQVYARDGNRCLRCGHIEDLQIDHIYPWADGGPTKLSNLQTLCRRCNNWKGDRRDRRLDFRS